MQVDDSQPHDARDFFERASERWSDRYRTDPSFELRIGRILHWAGVLPTPPQIVLDFGCGSGDLVRELIARGCRVVGADVSRGMLQQASQRSGLTLGVELFQISPERMALPLADETVSLCIASSVFEYVHDLRQCLGELRRVLAPEGRLVVTVPDVDHPVRKREAKLQSVLRIPLVAPVLARTRWAEGATYLTISRNRLSASRWIEEFAASGLRATVCSADSHPLLVLSATRLQ